jgi:hypothetical protein
LLIEIKYAAFQEQKKFERESKTLQEKMQQQEVTIQSLQKDNKQLRIELENSTKAKPLATGSHAEASNIIEDLLNQIRALSIARAHDQDRTGK